MTIDIDIEKLKTRKLELESELKKISDFLSLAEQFSRPVAVLEVKKTAPVQATLPVISTKDEPRRGFTAGLRRAVIMALYTGPATESELARALVWDATKTRQVLGTMLKFKVCFLNQFGRLELSPEGKAQAMWYLDNPGRLTYTPNGRGGRRQDLGETA